jgi:hypothetical protein
MDELLHGYCKYDEIGASNEYKYGILPMKIKPLA